jgi:hypothetical protein
MVVLNLLVDASDAGVLAQSLTSERAVAFEHSMKNTSAKRACILDKSSRRILGVVKPGNAAATFSRILIKEMEKCLRRKQPLVQFRPVSL